MVRGRQRVLGERCISKCKENFAWTAVVIWLFLGSVVVMFWSGRGVGRWLSRLVHGVISGLM